MGAGQVLTGRCPDISYDAEGMVAVPGGRVWYGIYGSWDKPPLLTVHGGPGAPHYYLVPSMKELAGGDHRPVIFYDQLGCGKSERPSDRSLWTVERYRQELESVVAALRLERFHLFGHSWGTQLALNYAAGQPRGLLSVSLASPIFDIPAYRRDLQQLLRTHPADVRDNIRNHKPGSDAYQEALMRFYAAHLHRIQPWPECWRKSFSDEEFGAGSYFSMVGSDELNYTGVLKDADDAGLLASVTAPIWFACGRADIALPERCREYQRSVPGSELTVFEKSSHAFFDEERPSFLAAFREFLRRRE